MDNIINNCHVVGPEVLALSTTLILMNRTEFSINAEGSKTETHKDKHKVKRNCAKIEIMN